MGKASRPHPKAPMNLSDDGKLILRVLGWAFLSILYVSILVLFGGLLGIAVFLNAEILLCLVLLVVGVSLLLAFREKKEIMDEAEKLRKERAKLLADFEKEQEARIREREDRQIRFWGEKKAMFSLFSKKLELFPKTDLRDRELEKVLEIVELMETLVKETREKADAESLKRELQRRKEERGA